MIVGVELLNECQTSHQQREVPLSMMMSMMIVEEVDESDRSRSEEKNYHTSSRLWKEEKQELVTDVAHSSMLLGDAVMYDASMQRYEFVMNE